MVAPSQPDKTRVNSDSFLPPIQVQPISFEEECKMRRELEAWRSLAFLAAAVAIVIGVLSVIH